MIPKYAFMAFMKWLKVSLLIGRLLNYLLPLGDWASQVAQMVKNLLTMQETRVRSLGWEDTLEKEMRTHSSTLAWKIPWTEEPGRGCKMSDTTERLHDTNMYGSLHISEFSSSAADAAAKSHQSCLTLCDPIDGSPPGSPVPGILQARTLEWVAISCSNA